jgi:hypothetical protein
MPQALEDIIRDVMKRRSKSARVVSRPPKRPRKTPLLWERWGGVSCIDFMIHEIMRSSIHAYPLSPCIGFR